MAKNKKKCFDVRYGRGDVVFTIFAKDETEAWDIASDLRDQQYKRDEHDFYGIECEESDSNVEPSECENYYMRRDK